MKEGKEIRICLLAVTGIILILAGSCNKRENRHPEAGTVTDVDGNIYKTVKIGTQWWMAENLKTTRFNDCTAIPLVTDDNEWGTLTDPGYCYYNNDAATYKNTFGILYNWYAVNTGKLAPAGWHVPTDDEWTILTDFLGGESSAGLKLKEAGTAHWAGPNAKSDNMSGFSALPGGSRISNGVFNSTRLDGYWWTATGDSTFCSWGRNLQYGFTGIFRHNFVDQSNGFSVRCVRD